MFSSAYVILPLSTESPAEAIRASLARFDTGAVRAEMELRGLLTWSVRFDAVEPDRARFFERFGRVLERHPATGRHGFYRNGLGRWDWWDLGGRFNGRIAGERRQPGRAATPLSSGPNRGRALLEGVEKGLAAALGAEPPPVLKVAADDNIELVSRLLDDAHAGLDHAFPDALVLPPGSAPDRLRWLGAWPEVGPADALAALGLTPDTDWPEVVRSVYARFPDQ